MAKKVFNMQGGLHSAAAYAAFENRAYGSCVASAASFVVTPGAGMNLNISTGDGLISVDAFLARRIQVTATETAAVSAANASFNRIDTVVAYIDTAVAPTTAVIDNVNDVLKFKVVPGTAAATPAAPTGAAIQASIGAGNPYMVLYDVLVPQGATNVAGVTLTDRRTRMVAQAIADGIVTNSKIGNLAVKAANIDFSTFGNVVIPTAGSTSKSITVSKRSLIFAGGTARTTTTTINGFSIAISGGTVLAGATTGTAQDRQYSHMTANAYFLVEPGTYTVSLATAGGTLGTMDQPSMTVSALPVAMGI